MVSPCLSSMPSPSTGLPLILGGDAPSIGFNRNDALALTMDATCTPGRPTGVSALVKATNAPALTPDSSLTDASGGAEGVGAAGAGTLGVASGAVPGTAAAGAG